MKAFIEGAIKLIEKNSFKDAKTGDPVEYFKYSIQDDEQGVLHINSKQDFSKMLDEQAVFTLDVAADYNSPSKFRVKILDVKAA